MELTSNQLIHVKRPNVKAFGKIGENSFENIATWKKKITQPIESENINCYLTTISGPIFHEDDTL